MQRSRKRLFSPVVPTLLIGLVLLPVVARADYESDRKLADQVHAALDAKDGTPQERLAKAQALATQAQGNPSLQMSLLRDVANFQRCVLNDPKAAIATCEAGLKQFPDVPERFQLVGYKIDAMTQDDPDAAVAYAKTQWPLVVQSETRFLSWVALPYEAALHATGDDAAIPPLLEQVWGPNLRNVGNWQGSWMADELCKSLLESGKSQEALSDAKLNWMLCAFDSDSIQNATKTLLTTWAQNDTGGKNSDLFVKAQSDASAPNPLKEVPLPALSPDVLKEQLARAGGGASEARITVLLASGQLRRAMLAARSLMVDHPDSPDGVSQVCRVFKAADLNLVRANGFVAWVKKPDGPNPILTFLQDHPAASDAAPTTATPAP